MTAKSCKDSEFLAGGTSANDPFDTAEIFSTPSFLETNRYAVWTTPFDPLAPAMFAVRVPLAILSQYPHARLAGRNPSTVVRCSINFICECAPARKLQRKARIAASFSALRACPQAINSEHAAGYSDRNAGSSLRGLVVSVMSVMSVMMSAKVAASETKSDTRSATIVVWLRSVICPRSIVTPWRVGIAPVVAAVVARMMTMMTSML